LKALDVDGTSILKCVLQERDLEPDYIDLAQYRAKWQAVVNTAMNLRVYTRYTRKMRDISCLTEEVLASQEEIRSSDLVC